MFSTRLCESWHPSTHLHISLPRKALTSLKNELYLSKTWKELNYEEGSLVTNAPNPSLSGSETIPFATWPWKEMLTHPKLKVEESQNSREGNLSTKDGPRWFIMDKCGRSEGQQFGQRKKSKLLKCRVVDSSKEIQIPAVDSLGSSPCCCRLPNPECECVRPAGPIFPWSVEGAVKHILS